MPRKAGETIPARASGRWIRTLEGYRAFHPNPLPPHLDWTPALASALADASLLVGRLAGEGRRLPNPHLLIRPFVRREAVLSSRIEGTQATLGELLAAEAGAAVDRSPDDLREVGNYVAALEHGIGRLQSLPMSLRLVRELHEHLMTGVRGAHATPGEFRRTQNWIGRPGETLAHGTHHGQSAHSGYDPKHTGPAGAGLVSTTHYPGTGRGPGDGPPVLGGGCGFKTGSG